MVLQALSHFQRHFGKASPLKIPFFRLTSERIIVDVTDSTKVKRHSRTFQNCLGCPGEFCRSLFEKWSEPLRHKIDLEWEHHIESKYNRCPNAALGWELIGREWDNIFPIQKTVIEERNPSEILHDYCGARNTNSNVTHLAGCTFVLQNQGVGMCKIHWWYQKSTHRWEHLFWTRS